MVEAAPRRSTFVMAALGSGSTSDSSDSKRLVSARCRMRPRGPVRWKGWAGRGAGEEAGQAAAAARGV